VSTDPLSTPSQAVLDNAGKARWVKLFSSAVIAQALLSAANFIVGLMLIRHSTDEDYGHYVLGFSALLLLTGIQSAYIGGPIAVLAPRQSAERKQRMVATLYRQSTRWILLGALSLAVAFGLMGLAGLLTPLYAVMAVVYCATAATALQREYLRTALMIYERPQSVLLADIAYVVILVAGAAAAALLTRPAAPWMFAVMAAAALLAAIVAHRQLAANPGLSGEPLPEVWRDIAMLGAWSVAGCIIHWSFSQGYNYVVAATLDLTAVAALNATRLLLMPVNLLITGIKSLLLPMAARWHNQQGLDAMLRRLMMFSAAVLFLTLIYYMALWLSREWLVAEVLKKQLLQRDPMLLCWMAVFLLSGVRDLSMTALLVREQFRLMSYLTAVAAVFALSTCWLGIQLYGAVGAVGGLILGESINLIGVFCLIQRERKLARNS
jgi:O-antigen/teichoic acid export membrane protein